MNVNRENFNSIDIKFVGRKPHNMHLVTTTHIKRLKLRRGASLIEKILKNIKNYNPIDVKFEPNLETIQE
jgi:hypothetical protein